MLQSMCATVPEVPAISLAQLIAASVVNEPLIEQLLIADDPLRARIGPAQVLMLLIGPNAARVWDGYTNSEPFNISR